MNLEQFASRGLKAQAGVDQVLKPINATPFINRAACKSFLLEHAAATRAHKFHRVSSETLREINDAVRAVMTGKIRALPSKGKTI
jgi:hypothetical protein